MNNVELIFSEVSDEMAELLIAELSYCGFESFWQENNELRAYQREPDFDYNSIELIVNRYNQIERLNFHYQIIAPDKWDKGEHDTFEPFIIGDEIIVRQEGDVFDKFSDYELIVNPNLAFGSGNHPSTYLCLEMMLDVDFKEKRVVDIGTGTGILAAMSEKMGAKSIFAFDNNPWAIEVAKKTMLLNSCSKIKLEEKDIQDFMSNDYHFDIVLANLNFSVFQSEYKNVAQLVNSKNGFLLVSGIMLKDEHRLIDMYQSVGFRVKQKKNRRGWTAILFIRT